MEDPLLLSVRSGAKFSMPGMMNTILNLGLNDETTEGLAKKTGNPRFAYDCYRRFIQMFGEVALHVEMEKFDHIFDARKAEDQGEARHGSDCRRSEGHHRRLQKAGEERNRQRVPAGCAAAADDVARCRVQLLEHAESHLLPAHGEDSGFHRHRGQCAGDGVRQHGRQLGHGCWVHAQSVHGRERFSTASSW